MPIGLVSDLHFSEELKRVNTDVSVRKEITLEVEILEIEKPGRSKGDTNIPESLRKVIAEEQLLNGRSAALDLAKDFGVSSSSVSAYARGATSTASYNSPSSSLVSHLNKSRERAVKRASKTLNSALAAITQDKLDYADASDLSGIAKDMSVIIKNLEPQKEVNPTEGKQTPQFVIFAPQFRDERSFEVIQSGE